MSLATTHGMNPVIRRYQSTDLDELLDVWMSASKVAHPFLSPEFLSQERENIAAIYLPNAETWVCEVDQKVVGFLALLGNEVGGIFVAPTHQRGGIGRQLMDHAVSIRGDLELEVLVDNSIGRGFYEHYGFISLQQKPHPPSGHPVLRLRYEAPTTV
ncbi:GNAT family N-acetyltransferase [Rhodopirellula sp. P2]|uniref:GNAT family N-acetyltransferase n=1 Tax=Rhodopirellula sp. P2 TaxID=2127060 RepID=UPI002367D15C|nr:GNAT family N-acetyltransferase [Rhodopirellula sp. P2]WDQ17845.1 GNAT family N-acetyltransferase [Rhodopirellula sp. P2]